MKLKNISYKNSDIKAVIADYVHSQRDRDVLLSRYVDGYTYEQIAELYDLSVRQIKNIIYKHEVIIFEHL
jgi:DNA-binding CsgD family transcriptional regulator